LMLKSFEDEKEDNMQKRIQERRIIGVRRLWYQVRKTIRRLFVMWCNVFLVHLPKTLYIDLYLYITVYHNVTKEWGKWGANLIYSSTRLLWRSRRRWSTKLCVKIYNRWEILTLNFLNRNLNLEWGKCSVALLGGRYPKSTCAVSASTKVAEARFSFEQPTP
jgi:hypothetical protein